MSIHLCHIGDFISNSVNNTYVIICKPTSWACAIIVEKINLAENLPPTLKSYYFKLRKTISIENFQLLNVTGGVEKRVSSFTSTLLLGSVI